ncbi:hypothetical protein AAOGI_02100 [Agarivorans albus]
MISTYSRIHHLKQTINALKKNTLADTSHLYIFSDAPKPGDEDKVSEVRRYLKSVTGFKKVCIVERQTNGRTYNNRQGLKFLLEKYGKVILLEDDNLTAPGFLDFMNEALDVYKHSPQVLSVSGYLPPINTNTVQTNAVLIKRFTGWGVGLWKDKYELIKKISAEEFNRLKNTPKQLSLLKERYGEDLYNRFRAESLGHLDAIDVRACYLQFKSRLSSVYPRYSLIRNIGNDGSGLHSSVNDKYDTQLWTKTGEFELNDTLKEDRTIDDEVVSFYRPDHRDMSPEIVQNIIHQLTSANISNICLWGTDVLTDILLEKISHSPFHVKYVMDTWAEQGQCHKGYELITPAQAIERGERNFVILSFASRFKMKAAAEKLSAELNIFMYQEQSEPPI